jgi:hypothetical protein
VLLEKTLQFKLPASHSVRIPSGKAQAQFLVFLSTRRASCKEVLCLGLNPNCSSRISPHSLTSCKILANRIFSKSLAIVYKRLMGR